jgi:ubiquinone/menaquinone biosynthesis C-methylase UbiE
MLQLPLVLVLLAVVSYAIAAEQRLSLQNNEEFENLIKSANCGIQEGTAWLIFRDLPALVGKYVTGKKALDYGCGTGRSTRFLRDIGLEPLGVDISEKMLTQAIHIDPRPHYLKIASGKIPVPDSSYDCVLSCLVLFDVSTKAELIAIMQEMSRILKEGGICIIVTGSEEMYKHKWLSLDVDYPENKTLQSGQNAKVRLKEFDMVFHDFFWTNQDCEELIKASQLKLVEKHFPLGEKGDGFPWIDELIVSPYAIYICRK